MSTFELPAIQPAPGPQERKLTPEDESELERLFDYIGEDYLGGNDQWTIDYRQMIRLKGEKAVEYLLKRINELQNDPSDRNELGKFIHWLNFAATPNTAAQVGSLYESPVVADCPGFETKRTLTNMMARIGNPSLNIPQLISYANRIVSGNMWPVQASEELRNTMTVLLYMKDRAESQDDAEGIAMVDNAVEQVNQIMQNAGMGRLSEGELREMWIETNSQSLEADFEDLFRHYNYLDDDYGDNSAFDDYEDLGPRYGDDLAFDDLELTYNSSYPSQRESEEELMALITELRAALDRTATPFNGENFSFFANEQEKRELFDYCASVAEYIRENKIADLVIVDRSSRPLYVGVKEYLKHKYPNEKLPGIYFLNPHGFKSKEDLPSKYETARIKEELIYKDNPIDPRAEPRHKAEIIKEFQEVYHRLLADKNKSVLVFDSCIHSGNTLLPLKETLGELGFRDVKIGSVNPEGANSTVIADYYITTQRPEKGCYPFDKDRMIEKVFDHTYSKRTDDIEKRRRAKRLREEISSIMKEYLAQGA